MKIKFNKTGAERKALVQAIGEILEVKPKYMGMPNANYEVDYFTIDKAGTLEFDDRADSEEIENLLEKLAERGFEAEAQEKLTVEGASEEAKDETADSETQEPIGFTVSVPTESVNTTNLAGILNAKGKLIQKAIGADRITFEETDGKVFFPWFDETQDSDRSTATIKLISAICKLSKTAKRITSKEHEVENEKYAFRCFLLRLGMIGDDYKAERKILMKNLKGSAAFKNGAKKEAVSDEISE